MSGEQITVDAAAWTGISLSQWPSPKDYAHPRPLRVRLSRRKQLVLGLGLLVVSLLSAQVVFAPAKPGVLRWATMVPCAAAAAIVGGLVLWRLYRRDAPSGLICELNAHGLTIPWWFERTVPWSEVMDVDYTRPLEEGVPRLGIWGIRIVVREVARFKPTRARAMDGDLIGKMLQHFLDISRRELFQAIQAHRAHFGRGGQPADIERI